jgi:thiol-disulfide isomerase/thioredoxin
MKRLNKIISGALVAASCWISQAAESADRVGEKAPELQVKSWVGKAPAKSATYGRPYILEFWATWCPPCRVSIPHLNELWQRVSPLGVAIMGLSDESPDTVKPFVKKMNMLYHVGINDGMAGSPEGSIPYAIVISAKGKIAWAGHPMDPEMEESLFREIQAWRSSDGAAVSAAQAGNMLQLQRELQQQRTPEALSGLKQLAANQKAFWTYASSLQGLEQHAALQNFVSLYQGFPQAQKAAEKIRQLEQDPKLSDDLRRNKVIADLQRDIGQLQQKAVALGKTKGDAAAESYYLGELTTLLEKFLQSHSDHPDAAQIRTVLEGVKKANEKGK